MATNQRYFYLKLKDSFFSSQTMVILENMPDGLLYSNLLLKMYLMSLKNDGVLLVNQNIPHTPQTIATITHHQIGTVERGIAVFLELGLVEQLTNGAYYMTDIQLYIGQSSTEAERKRRARQSLEQRNLLPASGMDICPPIVEIEPDINQNTDTKVERDRNAHYSRFGRYENVFLCEQDLKELQAEYPDKWEMYVQRLSEYMESSGRHFYNHAATIRRWISDDRRKVPKNAIPTYTCKEGESL